jgi:hypothetical protein
MDAPALGDWTLHFERDANFRITAVSVGCWLAWHVPSKAISHIILDSRQGIQ